MIAMPAAQSPAFPSALWSWNLFADAANMLAFPFMRNAFTAGTAAAIVAGLVGYFVVLRGSSFAAHAISHIGFAGAAGALLIGVSPILGVGLLSLGASGAMGALGKRLRGRDAVIGLIMAASLGLGVLFTTMYQGNVANALAYLFGQIFGISAGAALLTVATSVAVLAVLAALYRPLLFASLDEEVAEARGVRVGALSVGFLLLLGLAVTEAVQVTGVLLIFALLIAPGAIAERVTHRPARALAVSGSLAVLITWVSLTLAYYTPYPVSFYVPALAFALYLGVRLATGRQARPARSAPSGVSWPLPGRWHDRRRARTPATPTATVRT